MSISQSDCYATLIKINRITEQELKRMLGLWISELVPEQAIGPHGELIGLVQANLPLGDVADITIKTSPEFNRAFAKVWLL